MLEIVIVMMFWGPTGELKMQTRGGFANIEHCQASIAHDEKEFVKLFGNARGHCIVSPEKPAGMPEPMPKIKSRDA